MNNHHERGRRNETPKGQVSPLAAALLRISASLDLETVLREVVESARALTGSRYGYIATIDEKGEPQNSVFSGLTEAEDRWVAQWVQQPRLLKQLRDLETPLRVPDLRAYVRSLGCSSEGLRHGSLQGTPMRHRGVRVGSFFLLQKEGEEEFTSEDEEVLVVFASQAASAIAHARAFRDEQRARADLEALVETSPVGVVVLDARTGQVIVVNREARGIVEGVRTPGFTAEESIRILTLGRGDGREIALDGVPFPDLLSTGEIVRTEEIVLSAPDGRSVRTLINATPIHAADGTVETMVVTMQDLAPFEALDRMRAEFLGMVSHELRTPLAAVKGATATVLAGGRSFGPAETQQFFRIIDEQADRMSGLIGDLLDAGRIETGTLSVSPEPTEIGELVDQARTAFLSGGARHRVLIDLPPDLPRAMADRDRMVQVLTNLLGNAARHSPVSSPIRIAAKPEDQYVAVSVFDEGRGIAPERLPRLFRKYATSQDGEPGLGSGLGLAICKGLVEAHGGRIRAESAGPGQGARFTFTLAMAPESVRADPVPARAGSSGDAPEGARILAVDDDPQTLRYVRDTLGDAGFAPLVVADHRDLARIIDAEKPVLVLLSLILPGTDGIELMETVPGLAELPVIFISGYGRDETIARALAAGADDYIVKPFAPTELLARVQAALRHRSDPAPFECGELAIDYDGRRASVAGREIELTATEYELLRVLSLNAGRVSTYDSLLRQVWNKRNSGDAKVVRAVIKRLRQKLGDDANDPAYIHTERSVGYRMPRPGEA